MGYAYHEAGHAVAFHHFRMPIERILIINSPKKGTDGATFARNHHPIVLRQMGVIWERTPERWRYLSDLIMIDLAGGVAQTLHCPASVEPHHSAYDRIHAEGLMKQLLGYAYERDRAEKMEELLQETRDLLNRPRYAVALRALAEALIEHKDLSGKEATDIIVGAMKRAGTASNAAG